MMRAFNVRCCCSPASVLGSMLLPEAPMRGKRYHWVQMELAGSWEVGPADVQLKISAGRVTMQLREYMHADGWPELSFDSHDTTLEDLRKVRDFAEICQMPSMAPD